LCRGKGSEKKAEAKAEEEAEKVGKAEKEYKF
jgi:hypothetical protein